MEWISDRAASCGGIDLSILSIAGASRPGVEPGNSDVDGGDGNDGSDTDTKNSPSFQNALHEAPCINAVSLARLKAS
jgi:hypothetical protein